MVTMVLAFKSSRVRPVLTKEIATDRRRDSRDVVFERFDSRSTNAGIIRSERFARLANGADTDYGSDETAESFGATP